MSATTELIISVSRLRRESNLLLSCVPKKTRFSVVNMIEMSLFVDEY